MIKDIKYNGYTTQPSDYECPDGDLAVALNLIPENGSLNVIQPPEKVLTLSEEGERIMLIHSVPGQKNYIISRNGPDGLTSLFWLKKDPAIKDTSTATFIASFHGIRDIAVMGNTLVITTDEGIRYALWKDNGYKRLSNKPPFVSIDFGMYRVDELDKREKFKIPARCSPAWDGMRGQATNEELSQLTQMAYGLLLSQITEEVTSQGYFYMPFFIRYAYRLYDGSYSWHSVPILMLPTILPPFIRYSSNSGTPTKPEDTVEATLTLDVPFFGLAYRILPADFKELADWADIVKGIDVFISAPIYTYDQSKDLQWRPVTRSVDIIRQACTYSEGSELLSSAFVGHYANTINAKYVDHTRNLSASADNTDNFQCLDIRPRPEFHKDVADAHTFYKVAEINLSNLAAMSEMTRLPFIAKDLSSLVARPVLTDDYQSHCKLIPDSLTVYNSRLSLAGVNLSPAVPLPIRSVMQFGNPDGPSCTNARITVWTRLNGVRCYSVHVGDGSSDCDTWFDPAANFPRYIFYPDASAYKMEFYISDSQRYFINLTAHDFLNGAYWYLGKDGMGRKPTPASWSSESTDGCALSCFMASKIYTSEVNNPFYFPVEGIATVGTGKIIAISTAAKALSQGQFGQFPLYAFTDEGVWALEVASNGSYIARQPITRDVILEGTEPLQMDSAVLFATDRGIMLLSGSQTQCISDSINDKAPFNASLLPGMEQLHSMLGHKPDTCFPVGPFLKFVSGCGMLYDYVHQRVIVYNPAYTYAYVFSLTSKEWGMMYSSIKEGINSYPEALAIDHNGALLNFSSYNSSSEPLPTKSESVSLSRSEQTNDLLLTRPVKLEAHDVLKTVDTVIQQGRFRKGHVQSVLYGSRDLFDWHLIWSSKDHYLRGFRGTPYKYFRIALLVSLLPDESIYGATFQFNPRHTNQPR